MNEIRSVPLVKLPLQLNFTIFETDINHICTYECMLFGANINQNSREKNYRSLFDELTYRFMYIYFFPIQVRIIL